MYHSRFILNKKNARLHILEWSNQNKPTCLLLHGFSNNSFIWETVATQLSQHFHVYALDFRGHGDSDWDDAQAYEQHDFVEDLAYCINTLNLTNFHLVGHSLGARIAALYLNQHACSLKSFTIIDAGPEVNTQGSEKIRRDIQHMPLIYTSPEEYLTILKSIYFLGEAASLEKMAVHDLTQEANHWRLKFDPRVTDGIWNTKQHHLHLTCEDILWSAFKRITAPCLILRGQLSAILKKSTAQQMCEVMHNARLTTIPKAGHAVMTDNPSSTATSLLHFLLKIDATQSAKSVDIV